MEKIHHQFYSKNKMTHMIICSSTVNLALHHQNLQLLLETESLLEANGHHVFWRSLHNQCCASSTFPWTSSGFCCQFHRVSSNFYWAWHICILYQYSLRPENSSIYIWEGVTATNFLGWRHIRPPPHLNASSLFLAWPRIFFQLPQKLDILAQLLRGYLA